MHMQPKFFAMFDVTGRELMGKQFGWIMAFVPCKRTYMTQYLETAQVTCIDRTNSALASGAGTARDSLIPFLSWSSLWPFPAAPCLQMIITRTSLSVHTPLFLFLFSFFPLSFFIGKCMIYFLSSGWSIKKNMSKQQMQQTYYLPNNAL